MTDESVTREGYLWAEANDSLFSLSGELSFFIIARPDKFTTYMTGEELSKHSFKTEVFQKVPCEANLYSTDSINYNYQDLYASFKLGGRNHLNYVNTCWINFNKSYVTAVSRKKYCRSLAQDGKIELILPSNADNVIFDYGYLALTKWFSLFTDKININDASPEVDIQIVGSKWVNFTRIFPNLNKMFTVLANSENTEYLPGICSNDIYNHLLTYLVHSTCQKMDKLHLLKDEFKSPSKVSQKNFQGYIHTLGITPAAAGDDFADCLYALCSYLVEVKSDIIYQKIPKALLKTSEDLRSEVLPNRTIVSVTNTHGKGKALVQTREYKSVTIPINHPSKVRYLTNSERLTLAHENVTIDGIVNRAVSKLLISKTSESKKVMKDVKDVLYPYKSAYTLLNRTSRKRASLAKELKDLLPGSDKKMISDKDASDDNFFKSLLSKLNSFNQADLDKSKYDLLKLELNDSWYQDMLSKCQGSILGSEEGSSNDDSSLETE